MRTRPSLSGLDLIYHFEEGNSTNADVPSLSPKEGEKSLPRAQPRGWGTHVLDFLDAILNERLGPRLMRAAYLKGLEDGRGKQ